MSEPEQERIIATADAATIRRLSARRTRRSFLVGGAAAAAAYGVSQWIADSHPIGELQAGLRHTLDFDAAVNRAVFGFRELAPTYPVARARELRLNGFVGLDKTLDPAGWRLQLAGVAHPEHSPLYARDVTAWEYRYSGDMQPDAQALDVKSAPRSTAKLKPGDPQPPPVNGGATSNSLNPGGAADSDAGAAIAARFEALARGTTSKRVQGNAEAGASASGLNIGTPGLLLSMSDLAKLPKVEFCTEFKCIEGWSEITQWGGYRLRDLIAMFPPAKIVENGRERDPRYVYMETPDGNYYGGYDMGAALHPQSLLVTEMFGRPLTQQHGAPLRLHMPIKYGYKQIKRIGLIAYTDTKPDDFWTKLGYDWFAGI